MPDDLSSDALKARLVRAKLGEFSRVDQGISGAPREEQAAGPGGFSADTAVPGWMQSLIGGVAHGLGDVLHGGARIGARIGAATETPFGPEFSPERVQQVDTTAARREQAYQASPERRAHPYIAGAGQLIGETVGTAAEMGPLAVAAPEGMVPRWLLNLGIGGGAALATPKGGESMSPSAQAGRVAAGVVGGAIGTAVGEIAGSQLATALVGNDADRVSRLMTRGYRTLIKPPRGQRSTETQLKTQDNQILTAVDEIIGNNRTTKQADPVTLRGLSEALDQNKTRVFAEYDSQMRGAMEEAANQPNPHLIPKFRQTGAALQQAQNAVRDASNQATMTAAATQRAGNNVYMSGLAMPAQQQAQRRFAQAQAVATRTAQQHETVKAQLYKPYVDLVNPTVLADGTNLPSITNRLRSMSHESRFADLAPAQASAMNDLAFRLEQRGSLSLIETQNDIAALNKKLSAFYNNPAPAAASEAVYNAEVAGMMREALDKTIENLTGPGYQSLKNRYGALRAVEKDVVAAVQREANKIPGGIGGIFADLVATEAGIRGIATLNPKAIGAALTTAGARQVMKLVRDPNRAVARLFRLRASTFGQPQPAGGTQAAARAARYGLPRAGTIIGGQEGARRTRELRSSTVGP